MLDQFGGEANNQSVQYMSNNNLSNTKASLFLFSQRQIPDQVRRPHAYNFDGEFRMDLQNNIERNIRGQLYNHLDTLMPESIQAKHAVLPAAQGDQLRLQEFNEMWTFILVVDNGNSPSILGTRSFPGRMIYSGWVIDDPVYPLNTGHGVVPNPNAVFYIAHNTIIACPTIFTPQGFTNNPDVTGDYDYLPGQIAQQVQVDGSSLYCLSPKQLIGSIIEGDGATMSISPTPLTAYSKSIEFSTDINNPVQHLSTLVGAVGDSVKMNKVNGSSYDILDSFNNKTILEVMGSMVNTGINHTPGMLDPREPIPFSILLQRFNNDIDIVVCKRPFECQYDLGSPVQATRRNVFTALLAESVPSILANCNLAEIAFRYNSYERPDGGLGSIGNERGIFQLMNIATLYQCDQAKLSSCWDQFQYQMKMMLFPVIETNGGHFDLTMHCSLAGASLINLIMLDEVRDHGLLETNNLLGGLNTPLIGNTSIVTNNASQLFGVVQDVTNSNAAIITNTEYNVGYPNY